MTARVYTNLAEGKYVSSPGWLHEPYARRKNILSLGDSRMDEAVAAEEEPELSVATKNQLNSIVY